MANRTMLRRSGCAVVMVTAVLTIAPSATAQCLAAWTTHLPTARTEADAVFDAQRGRIVLFGGINGSTYRGDTWEFDGSAWTLAADSGPSARRGHKMVYDPLRGRTLLIGGYTSPASLGIRTWAWDGGTWRLIEPNGPAYTYTGAATAAIETAAAFDQARSRVVLVLANGQTWELPAGGGGWQLMSSTGPGSRRGVAMAYDRTRARVRLFGGAVGSSRFSDTWEWNGEQWQQIATVGATPSARSESRMTYDPVSRRIILYGGLSASGTRLRDVWSLSGNTWVQIAPAGPSTPAGGAGNTVVFDAARNRLMALGGAVNPWTDLATMDAAGVWTAEQFGPSARNSAACAYDQSRRRAVIFGGLGGARLADTWEFDGGTWRQVAATGPSARNESAMAYDPIRRRTVLFGGNTGSVNGETWEYDGAAWSLVATTGPSARERHAMVFDPIRGGVLLHGGAIAGGASNNQTWLWNGQTWSQIATGPTRASHAMAYFPPLDRVILYGGSGAGVSQTAFAWDGTSWSAIGGPGPSPSTDATLTFDPDSQHLALIGGSTSDAAVWLFSGADWRRAANIAGTARARVNLAAWADEARGGILTFGGSTSSGNTRETWAFSGVTGPVVESAPTWQVSCPAGAATFHVRVAATSEAESVLWLRDGRLIAPGPTAWGSTISTEVSTDGKGFTLSIDGITDADRGRYQCILTSACGGGTATNPAALRVCIADFNCSGTGAGDGVSEQDLFDFLAAWFAADPRADIDRNGDVGVQDLFEFLALFFAGC